MSRFISLTLRRASVTLLIALALVAAGIYAALNINQELTPDLEFPIVTVITAMPGAAAADIAEQVTIPLEAALANVAGMRQLNTVSAQNSSIMVAQFDFGEDMARAEQAIARAVSQAILPEDAMPPVVGRLNLNQILPVVQLSLAGNLSIPELEAIARAQIEPELRTIDGVQTVDILGGFEQQVLIQFDPNRMRAWGFSSDQIGAALSANNVSVPAGNIGQPGATFPLRVDSRLSSVEEIEQLVIGFDERIEGLTRPVELQDLATVELVEFPAGSISRTNGLPSVTIAVTKTQQANTVEVAHAVNAAIADVEAGLPDNVEVLTLLDQSVFIEEAISGLTRDAVIGAIGAVLAVWVLLLSFRSALIAGVSIPLSVLAAILILYSQGFTLNILTLGGLAIAIGRVVDDSIVVLENVYRHIQEGDDLHAAIVTGAREIAVPVFGSTLTAVGVFVPLIFAGGIVGVLFRPFAITVAVALLASTVVALTVIPVIARYAVGRRRLGERQGEQRDTFLQRVYTPVLRWSLGHRAWTLVIAAALFAGSFGLLAIIPLTFLPEEDDPQFGVNASLPPGIGTTEEVIALALRAEAVVADLPGIETYNATVTLGGGGDVFSLSRALQGQGTLGVTFFVTVEEGARVSELREMARERLEEIEGLVVSVQGGDQSQNQLQLSVTGDDPTLVRETAAAVLDAIQDVRGLEDLSSAAAVSQVELVIDVDSAAAIEIGSSASEIAATVRDLVVGQPLGDVRMHENGERIGVFLMAMPGTVSTVDDLNDVLVGPLDNPVRLGDIAEIREVEGPAQITRQNSRPSGIIQGRISGRETGAVQSDIDERVAQLDIPEGVRVEYGGAIEQFQEGFSTLLLGIAAAILIVYVAMVLTMGSLLYPFIIMFTLPLTSIGALAALAITGRPLSVAALFGVMMLVGIVVANGIVLIDFINQLRERRMTVYEALMEGGRLRVRPVLMTASSTILALLPMSLGLTEGASIAVDLAIVVIGGLISSTLLTLVVIPVIYSLVESLRTRLVGQP